MSMISAIKKAAQKAAFKKQQELVAIN